MAYAVPRACVRAAGDSWPLVCLYDSCLTAPAQPRHLFGCGCRTCGHPRITWMVLSDAHTRHLCQPSQRSRGSRLLPAAPNPRTPHALRWSGVSGRTQPLLAFAVATCAPTPAPPKPTDPGSHTRTHTHTHTAATPYKPDPNLDTARAGGCTAAQRQCPWLRPHQLCMRASCASRAGHPALGRRTRPSTNRTCPGVTCMHCDHA